MGEKFVAIIHIYVARSIVLLFCVHQDIKLGWQEMDINAPKEH